MAMRQRGRVEVQIVLLCCDICETAPLMEAPPASGRISDQMSP